jgi:hypothetical protein
LPVLGEACLLQGDHAQAARHLKESLHVQQAARNLHDYAFALSHPAVVAFADDNFSYISKFLIFFAYQPITCDIIVYI